MPAAEPEELAECMVAFANGDGGTIILGLDETGGLSETIWDEEAEGAIKVAAELCAPPIASRLLSMETTQGSVVGIQISRGSVLHSLTDGRILIRSGSQNRILSGSEISQLATSKSAVDYETDTVPGANRSDFDEEILEEYLAKRETRGVSRVGPLSELLFEIGAVDAIGQPTVAGILLFAKNPQAFLPQSGIVFVKFPSTEPRGDEGGAGYGRRDEIEGPLARVVERVWNVVWEEMRVGAVVNGLQREELTEYPPFAVREALVNAVAHRDYRVRAGG
ncbi:unnamed protein product, partial [marine sediment metagenome]